MSLYMCERLQLPGDEVKKLRRRYYETYGTTLRGLQIHHQVDPDDYLAYVHDLPLADYLSPQPELRQIVLSLPQRCWIFTNADSDHARRVLKFLGLEDCFTGIIDIRMLNFVCKPETQAYFSALRLASEETPENCVLIDDSAANLIPARKLGFWTILINENGESYPTVNLSIPNLQRLPVAMPELWEVA